MELLALPIWAFLTCAVSGWVVNVGDEDEYGFNMNPTKPHPVRGCIGFTAAFTIGLMFVVYVFGASIFLAPSFEVPPTVYLYSVLGMVLYLVIAGTWLAYGHKQRRREFLTNRQIYPF